MVDTPEEFTTNFLNDEEAYFQEYIKTMRFSMENYDEEYELARVMAKRSQMSREDCLDEVRDFLMQSIEDNLIVRAGEKSVYVLLSPLQKSDESKPLQIEIEVLAEYLANHPMAYITMQRSFEETKKQREEGIEHNEPKLVT